MFERIIESINRWIDGPPKVSPIIAPARITIQPPSDEELRDRALSALDLQVEIAEGEIRAKHISAKSAAQVIFGAMTADMKSRLPEVTLAVILEALKAEHDMPDDARR